MDKNPSDPLRHWLTPAQATAARKRKDTEHRRIWGAVLLSGVLAGVLGLATGTWAAFIFGWIVMGALFTSLACDEKEGPKT